MEGTRGTQGDVNECVWMLAEMCAMMLKANAPRNAAHAKILSELVARVREKAEMMQHERLVDLLDEAKAAL